MDVVICIIFFNNKYLRNIVISRLVRSLKVLSRPEIYGNISAYCLQWKTCQPKLEMTKTSMEICTSTDKGLN